MVVGKLAVQYLEGDAQFAARKVDSQAAMRPQAEAQVPVGRAVVLDLVGIGELLSELEESSDPGTEASPSPESANVREARRHYDRATKLP